MRLQRLVAPACLGLAAVAFTACSNDEEFPELTPVSLDRISRIDLSPNAPVLNADGTSKLDFIVRCYYKVDTLELRLPEERIPYSELNIADDQGNTFNIRNGYTSTSTADSVAFTATFRTLTSPQAKVALRQTADLGLTKLRIPLRFNVIYAERDKEEVANINVALINSMLERVNKVFAGTIENAPNGYDAKMEFYLKEYRTTQITPAQSENIDTYLASQQNDSAEVVNVWLLSNFATSDLREGECKPAYTLGSKSDLPGLDLSEIESLAEVEKFYPQEYGIAMSFSDLYQYASGNYTYAFGYLLGVYYGLLDTGAGSSEDGDSPVDYCDDTYNYRRGVSSIRKNTIADMANRRTYTYDSFNIMGRPSRSSSLSKDQVKRIRQVIKDCPLRQQGEEQP